MLPLEGNGKKIAKISQVLTHCFPARAYTQGNWRNCEFPQVPTHCFRDKAKARRKDKSLRIALCSSACSLFKNPSETSSQRYRQDEQPRPKRASPAQGLITCPAKHATNLHQSGSPPPFLLHQRTLSLTRLLRATRAVGGYSSNRTRLKLTRETHRVLPTGNVSVRSKMEDSRR